LAIADQNAEEMRRRQKERSRKNLDRRLELRTTTLIGSVLIEENDNDKCEDNCNDSNLNDHNVDLNVRRTSVRHSRSSVFRRRESARLTHQRIQQLQSISLQGKDNNNNKNNTSTESPFVLAKRNVLETKRRLSARGRSIVHGLMQAQCEATLRQDMEMVEEKAAMHKKLNARLKGIKESRPAEAAQMKEKIVNQPILEDDDMEFYL